MSDRNLNQEGQLKLTCDRKVSPTAYWYESKNMWVATTPNSFGLPSGATCPNKTDFCQSCYGANMENFLPWVREQLEYNWNLLNGADEGMMVNLLDNMVCRFSTHAHDEGKPKIFRIHWNGDFFSNAYANAWRIVMRMHSSVQFWTYTRSFHTFGPGNVDVLPQLSRIPNLQLYLSVDEHNAQHVPRAIKAYPGLRIAWCTRDFHAADDLAARWAPDRVAVACPENTGARPLVNDQGVGACVTCEVCIKGTADIQLTTSHRASATNVTIHRKQGRLAL